jgi:hypothetical protein
MWRSDSILGLDLRQRLFELVVGQFSVAAKLPNALVDQHRTV